MKIERFSGAYRWLSNFEPVLIKLDGLEYATAEHAYQASKFEAADRIQFTTSNGLMTAGQAKRLGKKLSVRSDWECVKVNSMRSVLLEKFKDIRLRGLLLDTFPNHIEEANTWGDTFWGVCDGTGKNTLGKLLMQIRGDLKGFSLF